MTDIVRINSMVQGRTYEIAGAYFSEQQDHK